MSWIKKIKIKNTSLRIPKFGKKFKEYSKISYLKLQQQFWINLVLFIDFIAYILSFNRILNTFPNEPSPSKLNISTFSKSILVYSVISLALSITSFVSSLTFSLITSYVFSFVTSFVFWFVTSQITGLSGDSKTVSLIGLIFSGDGSYLSPRKLFFSHYTTPVYFLVCTNSSNYLILAFF